MRLRNLTTSGSQLKKHYAQSMSLDELRRIANRDRESWSQPRQRHATARSPNPCLSDTELDCQKVDEGSLVDPELDASELQEDGVLPSTVVGQEKLLSVLELRAEKIARDRNELETALPSSKTESRPSTKELPVEKLTLPKSFDTYSAEHQQILIELERAKERERDLGTIKRTYKAIAILGCLGPFNPVEVKEIQECGNFLKMVVDQGLPGKVRRGRIQDIRDNMLTRIGKCDDPPEDSWKDLYNTYLDRRHYSLARFEQDIGDLDEKITRLRDERANQNKIRNNSQHRNREARVRAKQKKVRFASSVVTGGPGHTWRDVPEGVELDLLDSDSTRARVTLTADEKRRLNTENRRHAQYQVQDRKEVRLQAQLALFKANDTSSPQPGAGQTPETAATAHENADAESEVSEEDAGHETVFAAGRREPAVRDDFFTPAPFPGTLQEAQDDEEINRLENSRQQEERARAAVSADGRHASHVMSGQASDQDLLERMRKRRAEGYQGIEATGRPSVLENGVNESDDEANLSLESEPESEITMSDNEPTQIFKYEVHAQTAGIQIYNDYETYTPKTYSNLKKANQHVADLTTSLLRRYPPEHGVENGCWNLNTIHDGGMWKQLLKIGIDENVQARVWVERRVVELDARGRRGRKIRRQMKQRPRPHWVVEWEEDYLPGRHRE